MADAIAVVILAVQYALVVLGVDLLFGKTSGEVVMGIFVFIYGHSPRNLARKEKQNSKRMGNSRSHLDFSRDSIFRRGLGERLPQWLFDPIPRSGRRRAARPLADCFSMPVRYNGLHCRFSKGALHRSNAVASCLAEITQRNSALQFPSWRK